MNEPSTLNNDEMLATEKQEAPKSENILEVYNLKKYFLTRKEWKFKTYPYVGKGVNGKKAIPDDIDKVLPESLVPLANGFFSIAWLIVMFLFVGFWVYIWIHRTTKYLYMRTSSHKRVAAQVALCIFVPFYYIYWMHWVAKEVDKLGSNLELKPIHTKCVVLSIFVSTAACAILQDRLNDIVESECGIKLQTRLEKTYVRAVNDVTFSVKYGETLGIVGESGCGKSTMGRSVLRLHDITDGRIVFDGTDITKLKPSAMRKLRTQMQIIFQDPYSSLPPRSPVGDIIGEAVKVHKIVPKSEYRDYVQQIMRKCGLQDFYFDRYPHEFSGGQRQRICIARALAVKPKFIVCDEPVSALDVSIQAQIINLLKELQRDLNLTYLFISHDLSVVQHISDRVGVMYLGSFVELGNKNDIFNSPMHPYTHALLSAVPVPDPHYKGKRIILQGDIPSPAHPPKGCKFHTRCSQCMEICKEVAPKFIDYGNGHMCACHLYPQDGNEVNPAQVAPQVQPTEQEQPDVAQA